MSKKAMTYKEAIEIMDSHSLENAALKLKMDCAGLSINTIDINHLHQNKISERREGRMGYAPMPTLTKKFYEAIDRLEDREFLRLAPIEVSGPFTERLGTLMEFAGLLNAEEKYSVTLIKKQKTIKQTGTGVGCS